MEIPKNVKTYNMLTSTIWIDEDGIVFSVPYPEVVLNSTDEEIKKDIKKFRDLVGNKKVCIILETNPKQPSPPRNQRDLIAEQLNSVVKAMAIITKSPVSKMMVNLFFNIKPPSYPTRMFIDPEEAKAWIMKYCKD